MIEEAYIAQLEKHYKSYLKNIIAGNPFAPIVLRGGKNRPQTSVDLHKLIAVFQKYDKSIHKNGWHIEWEEWSSRTLGVQRWPSLVRVDTEEDYLLLIDRQALSRQFKERLENLISWKPGIRDFLFHRPEWVLDLKEQWAGIQAVVDYLLQHEVKGHYIRSIPVPVHTKFIQQYRTPVLALLQYFNPDRFDPLGKDLEESLALLRKPYLFTMRWLDPSLGEKYSAGMEVMGVTKEYLATVQWTLRQVIVVENETNLYLLPPMPGTLALFSAGKALHLLRHIPLIADSELYYWGDLDEDGFIMLHDLRNLYGHAKSLLMDIDTVVFHDKEMATQPAKYKRAHLPLLTPSEQAAFEIMHRANGRIEQEKLQQDYVAEKLKTL